MEWLVICVCLRQGQGNDATVVSVFQQTESLEERRVLLQGTEEGWTALESGGYREVAVGRCMVLALNILACRVVRICSQRTVRTVFQVRRACEGCAALHTNCTRLLPRYLCSLTLTTGGGATHSSRTSKVNARVQRRM